MRVRILVRVVRGAFRTDAIAIPSSATFTPEPLTYELPPPVYFTRTRQLHNYHIGMAIFRRRSIRSRAYL